MPGKPSEQTQALEGQPGVENHLLMLETKLAGYVVSYVVFSNDVTDPARIKDLLDRGREGGLGSSGATLKSEKEIKLNDYFGREWLRSFPMAFQQPLALIGSSGDSSKPFSSQVLRQTTLPKLKDFIRKQPRSFSIHSR